MNALPRNLRKCYRVFSTSSTPKEKFVNIEKYKINYLKVGHGPHHVLCTQGALGSIWTDFKHQVGGFDEKKFTVIFWDPPGFGKSRPPLREFSSKFYFNDARVSSLLMKELNIPRYSLLGWSNGSITSMVHAANHPDCVQKLVIWGANCFILPEEAAHYKDMKDVSLWSKKMKQPMIDMYGEELFASYWIQWVDSMDELIRNTGGDVCSTLVPQIKCPTLILYGEKDPLVRRVHLEYLQKHIKNHQTHLYPDGKHNIHIRHYEDFNRRVQAFLLS